MKSKYLNTVNMIITDSMFFLGGGDILSGPKKSQLFYTDRQRRDSGEETLKVPNEGRKLKIIFIFFL
jgi:hypothetical protein